MKKYFTTGVAIILPIFLTSFIVVFFINLLTRPFLGIVESFIANFDFFKEGTTIFHNPEFLLSLSKIFILIGLVGFIFLIGFLGQLFLVKYLFKFGNAIFQKIPYINKIYLALQEVVHSLFSSESKSFSQVVLVPFPNSNALSVGLITREYIKLNSTHKSTSEMIPVFVPGTPNPSVGFMLMFREEQLIFVNMKVEDAMKFIVSCGVVLSEFKINSSPKQNKDF
ncbi:MAG: DUF502 domain-containing protein [Parachlamydiaceae bacterium]|nr:DUF502 domain-containing protein [Parachlamydiaceae bacterium]